LNAKNVLAIATYTEKPGSSCSCSEVGEFCISQWLYDA